MLENISTLFSRELFIKFIKFAIVGAIGTFFNLAILFLFTDIFNVYYIISEIFAFYISVLNNYFLNKVWTFKEDIRDMVVIKHTKYVVVNLIALLVNLSILYTLVEFFNFWYILAEFFAIVCAFLVNFVGNLLWTFRRTEENEKNDKKKHNNY